eukprot:Sspe_Gene.86217::Locus_56937_Transcript_1_2_Confidence_0.750_Length_1268::g.86217::m.86217
MLLRFAALVALLASVHGGDIADLPTPCSKHVCELNQTDTVVIDLPFQRVRLVNLSLEVTSTKCDDLLINITMVDGYGGRRTIATLEHKGAVTGGLTEVSLDTWDTGVRLELSTHCKFAMFENLRLVGEYPTVPLVFCKKDSPDVCATLSPRDDKCFNIPECSTTSSQRSAQCSLSTRDNTTWLSCSFYSGLDCTGWGGGSTEQTCGSCYGSSFGSPCPTPPPGPPSGGASKLPLILGTVGGVLGAAVIVAGIVVFHRRRTRLAASEESLVQ